MKQDCTTCLHSTMVPNMMTGAIEYHCAKELNDHGCIHVPCEGWSLDRHVAAEKPPLGCAPYYVHISARICDLCEAVKRNATESGKHNQIKLWVTEIQYLNEMDRFLARTEREKTFVETKDGKLEEIE